MAVRPRLALFAGALALLALPAQAAGVLEGLRPHRAVYDLTLEKAGSDSGIDSVSGRMVYEFTGSMCEGFASSFRFVTRVGSSDGGFKLTDLRNTTFEDAAGKTFQFMSQTFVDQALADETKGSATREGDKVVVTLSKPEAKTATIDGHPYFPTGHLVKVIEAAEAGDRFAQVPLFDGSNDGVTPISTTAVIGQKITGPEKPEGDEPKAVEKLGDGPRWPVTLSFFEKGDDKGGEQTPDYQLSFLAYPDGVSRRMRLDYGSFTLSGSLSEIEFLEPTPCK
ncbi:cell envelope integrity EipB family protein [Segnochrobactraceae bacterium EtOH-i3]